MTFRKLPSSRDFSIASTFVSWFFFFFWIGFLFVRSWSCDVQICSGRMICSIFRRCFLFNKFKRIVTKTYIPPLHEHQQSGWLLLPKGGIRRAVLATTTKKHQHFQLLWLLSKIAKGYYFISRGCCLDTICFWNTSKGLQKSLERDCTCFEA